MTGKQTTNIQSMNSSWTKSRSSRSHFTQSQQGRKDFKSCIRVMIAKPFVFMHCN